MNKVQIDEITRTAVQTALEYMDKEKLKRRKINQDKRLRNTKLLLKNYRSFVAHCEELESKLTLLQEAQTLNELHTEEYVVESIKKSKARTLVMTRFIQQMVSIYRGMCEASRMPEDLRRYKIIESLYISDEIKTVDELAECHFIDTRTVYRDINDAAKALSVLIFGIDGVQLE